MTLKINQKPSPVSDIVVTNNLCDTVAIVKQDGFANLYTLEIAYMHDGNKPLKLNTRNLEELRDGINAILAANVAPGVNG